MGVHDERDSRWAAWAEANGFDRRTWPFHFGIIEMSELFDHAFTARRKKDGLRCLVGDPYWWPEKDGETNSAAGLFANNGFAVTVVMPGFWNPSKGPDKRGGTTAFIFACTDPWRAFVLLKQTVARREDRPRLGPLLGVDGKTLAEFRKRYQRELVEQWRQGETARTLPLATA